VRRFVSGIARIFFDAKQTHAVNVYEFRLYFEVACKNELHAGNRWRKTMSESEMQAELERLRAENAQLKSKDKGRPQLRVDIALLTGARNPETPISSAATSPKILFQFAARLNMRGG
jgi:hypothetical protein